MERIGGVAMLVESSGGVDPRVGVFDAGDLRVAGDPAISSTEC